MLQLGAIRATCGALDAVEGEQNLLLPYLTRHERGDWGDLDSDDKAANEASLRDGSRLLSSYNMASGGRLWIITEAEGDDGQRSATTILTPEEY